ncbi:hypothetical protein LXL04_030870 [Taraxacum kok-saghyz]
MDYFRLSTFQIGPVYLLQEVNRTNLKTLPIKIDPVFPLKIACWSHFRRHFGPNLIPNYSSSPGACSMSSLDLDLMNVPPDLTNSGRKMQFSNFSVTSGKTGQRGSVPASSATFSLPSHSPGIGVHSVETYDPNLKISQSNLADSDSLAIKLSPGSNGNPFPKAELIDNSQFESSVYTDSINRVAKLTRKPVISNSLEPLFDSVFFFLLKNPKYWVKFSNWSCLPLVAGKQDQFENFTQYFGFFILHLRTETNQDPLMRSPTPAKSESPTTEEISVSGEPDPPTTEEFTDVKSFPSSSSSTAYNFHFDFDFLELLKLILKLILYPFFKLH